MKKRYDRNIGTISEEEQELLAAKAVCVVGCGGLGGNVIEGLVRMGVGRLTVVDCDCFEETNLNRQVLSNEQNLGKSKAVEAVEQMAVINSDVRVDAIEARLDRSSAWEIVAGHDVVVDALDNIEARLILERACEVEEIPLVHGAIGGWNGQVTVVMPGAKVLEEIYGPVGNSGSDGSSRDDGSNSCAETECEADKPTNPPFTPAVVAAMEAAETIKLLLGREEVLAGKILTLDLLNNEYEVIDF